MSMMELPVSDPCKWETDKSGFRFFVPGCWAKAVNPDATCICPGRGADVLERLEMRLDTIERELVDLKENRKT